MRTSQRTKPNILITGTPGTGKTSLGEQVANAFNFDLIQVSRLAEEKECFDGYDEELQCPFLDEDLLLDELEEPIEQGGKVVEYHSSEFFPERFFDAVFVLRCDNTVLYDRLKARGYNDKKVLENVQCEIMNVLMDEASDSYKEEIVFELQSSSVEDMEKNINTVSEWVNRWKEDNVENSMES